MPTTLQKQLELRGRAAGVGDRTKATVPSLLFEKGVAADLDIESVYSIGCNGLAELVQRDPLFGQFKLSLFSERAKTTERLQQTSEENKILDDELEHFLVRVSPHLLHQCAIKALEWLMRRFRIYEFNIDEYLASVLPFHETSLFSQVVKTFSLAKGSTRWEFLEVIAKSGIVLTRQALIQRMLDDATLLKFVCQMVQKSLKLGVVNKPQLSFFAALITEYLQARASISDNYARILLEFLFALTKAENNPEVHSMAFMVISQLGTKMPFSEKLLTSVLDAVSGHLGTPLESHAVLCLVTVYHHQPESALQNGLPDWAVQRFANSKTACEALAYASRGYSTEKLVVPFVHALIAGARGTPKYFGLIQTILRNAYLTPANVLSSCVKFINDCVVRENSSGETGPELKRFAKFLASTYSSQVDKAINEILLGEENDMKTDDDDMKASKISAIFNDTIHKPLSEGNLTVIGGLTHQNGKLRMNAILQLATMPADAIAGVSETLLYIIATDYNKVALAVFENVPNLPAVFAGHHDRLTQALLGRVFSTGNTPKSSGSQQTQLLQGGLFDLKKKALELLLTLEPSDQITQLLREHAVMEFMLLTKANRSISRSVLKALPSAEWLPHKHLLAGGIGEDDASAMLSSVVSKLKQTKNDDDYVAGLADVQLAVVDRLAKTLANSSAFETDIEFYLKLIRATSLSVRILSCLVLTKCISDISKSKHSFAVTKFFQAIVPQLTGVISEEFVQDVAKNERRHSLAKTIVAGLKDKPTEKHMLNLVLFWATKAVMSTIRRPIVDATVNIWQDDSVKDYSKLVALLFKALSSELETEPYQYLIKDVFQRHVRGDILLLLPQIVSTDGSQRSALLQARTLALATVAIKSQKTAMDYQLIIPTLLIAVQNEDQIVRKAAMTCIKAINLCYSKATSSSALSVYGYETLYGSATAKVEYLKPEQAQNLVAHLESSEDQVVPDANGTARALNSFLNAGAKQKTDQVILLFVLSNILAFPSTHGKRFLVRSLRFVESAVKLSTLLPLIEETVSDLTAAQRREDAEISTSSTENVAELGHKNELGMELVELFRNIPTKSSSNARVYNVFANMLRSEVKDLQMAALAIITPQWFAKAPLATRSMLFSALITLAVSAAAPTVAQATTSLLATLPLESHLFLVEISDSVSLVTDRRIPSHLLDLNDKAPSSDTVEQLTLTAYYRLTSMLELLERVSLQKEDPVLVDGLYALLDNMLNVDSTKGVPVGAEYIKQTILTNLIKQFGYVKDKRMSIEDSKAGADKVVACIQSTENPQTSNYALQLMTVMAETHPHVVLTSVMPVFTFMGSVGVQQDDTSSFAIIKKMVQTIIPALTETHRAKEASKEGFIIAVRPIVQLFVDALFHIPQHRRLGLFTVLITTLGESDFLDQVLAFCLLRLSEGNLKAADESSAASGSTRSVREFVRSIILEFSVTVQLNAFVGLVRLVASLPDEGDLEELQPVHAGLITNATQRTQRFIQVFKCTVVSYLSQGVSNPRFTRRAGGVDVGSAEDYTDDGVDPQTVIAQLEGQLIEVVMQLIGRSNVWLSRHRDGGDPEAVSANQTLRRKLHDTLENMSSLLTVPMFAQVVAALLLQKDKGLRKRTLKLVNKRVTAVKPKAVTEAVEQEAYLSLLEKMVALLEEQPSEADSQDVETIKSALENVLYLVRILASRAATTYLHFIEVMHRKKLLTHANVKVMVLSIECLGGICEQSGTRLIPSLGHFMADLFSGSERLVEGPVDAICSVLECFNVVVGNLPHFIGRYTEQLIRFVFCADADDNRPAAKRVNSKVQASLTKLQSTISAQIAPRVLLPILDKTLPFAFSHSRAAAIRAQDLEREFVSHLERSQLAEQHSEVVKLILRGFDLYVGKVTEKGLEKEEKDRWREVEGRMVETFLEVVVKMNETIFKPVFLRLMEWAVSSLVVSGLPAAVANARGTLFYHVIDSLLNRLKSIFAPYCGYLLDNFTSLLTEYEDKSKRFDAQWMYMMSSLYKCFTHANAGLIPLERATTLGKLLVEQVLAMDCNDASYMEYMRKFVVPTVGQLAVHVKNDAFWKKLHQPVLDHMKHEESAVKMVGILICQEFYNDLGEEFLVTLPETIPVLAELAEDEDEQVHAACQQLFAVIQEHLGEDLTQYF